MRERISARVLEALEKYFDGGFSGHVTVGKEAFGFHTECVVHLDSGIVLRAEAMAADAYLSADQAAEHLEKRLRRYHRRLKDYHAASATTAAARATAPAIDAPSYVIAAPEHESEEVTAFNPVIIAEFDHGAETVVGQRSGDGTRHDRARRLWCSVTPATAGLTWSIAGPTAMSAGSIRPPLAATTAIDGSAGRSLWSAAFHPAPLNCNRRQTGSMPPTVLVAPNAIIPALRSTGKSRRCRRSPPRLRS